MKNINFKIMGIDLAGKSENSTGICFLDKNELNFSIAFEDDEILSYINEINPYLIAVDAPLSLPEGRCCLSYDCSCSKVGGHFRAAEIEMRKYGRVLPLTFAGMRMLTERGIRITGKLKEKYEVIESHPRTIQKILGFEDLYADLNEYFKLPENITDHELDAALLVINGIFYVKNKFMELGNKKEGVIILPKKVDDLKEFLSFKDL